METCLEKTILTRRNEEIVVVLSLIDLGNGHCAIERRTVNQKYKQNTFTLKPFNTRGQAEGIYGNELIALRIDKWIDLESDQYEGSLRVAHIGNETFLLSEGELPTVICSRPRPDFDKGIEYILHDVTHDGYLLVENSYGETVHCQPDSFIHSLSQI
jgi:hypothetical protein